MIDLSGKVALVTGGSRGIGAATVKMLAQAGARVAFTYRTRKADAEAVAKAIDNVPPNHESRITNHASPGSSPASLVLEADVAEPADCERIVAETVKAFGRLDIFVANAAIWPAENKSIAEIDPERWSETLRTNLDSVFYGTQAAMRAMTNRITDHGSRITSGAGGRVVIVSSTAGQRGEAFHADYAASKGAIISFVKSVCVEAAPYGITVNAVAPGWVDTEMSAEPYGREQGAGRSEIEATIPLGRVATPEEIAGPIVFLCSNLGSSITGEILNVNGGSVLCG